MSSLGFSQKYPNYYKSKGTEREIAELEQKLRNVLKFATIDEGQKMYQYIEKINQDQGEDNDLDIDLDQEDEDASFLSHKREWKDEMKYEDPRGRTRPDDDDEEKPFKFRPRAL